LTNTKKKCNMVRCFGRCHIRDERGTTCYIIRSTRV